MTSITKWLAYRSYLFDYSCVTAWPNAGLTSCVAEVERLMSLSCISSFCKKKSNILAFTAMSICNFDKTMLAWFYLHYLCFLYDLNFVLWADSTLIKISYILQTVDYTFLISKISNITNAIFFLWYSIIQYFNNFPLLSHPPNPPSGYEGGIFQTVIRWCKFIDGFHVPRLKFTPPSLPIVRQRVDVRGSWLYSG